LSIKESVIWALNAYSICRAIVGSSWTCKTGEINEERCVDWARLADKGVWIEK
jgi:hypothetical protein